MQTKILFYVVAVMVIVKNPTQVKARNFTITALRRTFNPKFFSNFTVQVVKGNINTDMVVIKTLERGMKIFADFQLRLKNSKTYQSMLHYDVEICKLLESFKTSIFKKWFVSILKNGNFKPDCPVVPGYYYLREWNLDQENIPSYLLLGDYRIVGHVYYGKMKTKKELVILDGEVDASLA